MSEQVNKGKPVFQQTKSKQRFSDKKSPRFEHKQDDKPRRGVSKAKPAREPEGFVWAQSEMAAQKAGRNARGEVKVTIKGDVGVKKTGPLSPRAPEKIRKNRDEEMKIYGVEACLARFKQRPESIVRLWATVEMSHKLGEQLSFLASQKKVYHIVSSNELALVSGSEHHGGMCLLVKKTPPMALERYLAQAKRQDCVLVLDNVQNAHTLGAILRAAAFYGAGAVISEDANTLASPLAARVAEGALEHVSVVDSLSLAASIARLQRAGYQVIAITQDKQASALNKVRFADKLALVLTDNSEALACAVDETVVLSFDNPLTKGLNAAVNAGVVMSRWYFR
ncbi:rRNA methyltransferase [Pasteurellaceae bacterium HPA106]|uniref:TrmH family RNA methyltransferase n=1 Tax=Spirabiliibacterium pneumoniae TaxID=221400 RepID=UPI001AACEE86|nr:TrmH family RNA methyltransferase [Spirabiliibacterium pneumoniae]MBE2896449.1 rRNA methyltransferase [Spirabiliibacterium pneumoniae]